MMMIPRMARTVLAVLFLLVAMTSLAHADIRRFVGDYAGSAEVQQADGSRFSRDMSVSIRANKDGFTVSWSTISYREGDTAKEKAYTIDFVASDRDGVFAAAMTRNVFGHVVQMDPMKGEPYVWSRIHDDTLTVYSLFVGPEGGYELQQFDRTLADGGLMLEFKRLRDGEPQRSVSTFLKRQ